MKCHVAVIAALCVIGVSGILIPACGGCPDGTREYAGQCIPESSDEPPNNPYLPTDPPKTDGDDIVLPTQKTPPRDYNRLPGSDPVDLGDLEVVPIDTGSLEEDAVAAVIWIEGHPSNLVLPYLIEDPDGKEVYSLEYDLRNMAINDEYNFHYYPDSGLSLFLPNTPRIAFSPGPWNISVTSLYPGNTYNVQVYSRSPRPKNRPNNRMGVNIWFVGINGLDDSGEETAKFAAVMSVFTKLYAEAGIELSPITYKGVSTEQANTYGVLNDFDEYHEMMTLSSSVTNEWPNIFLVKGFAEMAGLLGMAAHIPGPPGLQGGRFSGVAVAMEYFEYYPRTMGLVMAHELAHWLGLFHPTESTGEYHDAIPDTPECVAGSHDHNQDGLVDDTECANHGADNVMFWLVSGDESFKVGPEGIHFSPEQVEVLMLNPLMQYVK